MLTLFITERETKRLSFVMAITRRANITVFLIESNILCRQAATFTSYGNLPEVFFVERFLRPTKVLVLFVFVSLFPATLVQLKNQNKNERKDNFTSSAMLGCMICLLFRLSLRCSCEPGLISQVALGTNFDLKSSKMLRTTFDSKLVRRRQLKCWVFGFHLKTVNHP